MTWPPDKQLQERRLDAYIKLWAMLERLARYGRSSTVTYSVLREISDQTRAWYFQTGGIYLTSASRGPYFSWKRAMQLLLDNKELGAGSDEPISDKQLENIIEAASALRTSLSDDIGTKRLSRL